jgi:rfaE bifunctional protein nucleotidyltransferase chain/domain
LPRSDPSQFSTITTPKKFFQLAALIPVIEEEKKRGRRVALANGGFDLLHVGHIRYLKQARETADLLVVAVNSDSSLRNLKGENRPVITAQGRIAILGALTCVDYVTLFEESTVDGVLLALKPHVHCKGSDYSAETVPEYQTVRSYGGETVIVGGDKIRSSSDILTRLRLPEGGDGEPGW